jgi:hypothetical protein
MCFASLKRLGILKWGYFERDKKSIICAGES